MPERPRVGLDCRLSGVRHGGIGRYEVALFSRLLVVKDWEWVVFLYNQDQQEALSERLSNQVKHVEWVISPLRHYSVAEQLEFPRVLQNAHLDLLHVPHFNVPLLYQGKTLITIHDLLWHQQKGSSVTTLPSWQYWPKYAGYRMVVNRAINKARAILVPSETIKKHLITQQPQTTAKITVTYEGVDSEFKPARKQRDKRRILYVGSLYPHKNVQLVLACLSELSDWQLRVITSRSVFVEEFAKRVAAMGLSERVTIELGVSDQVLLDEYQKATAVIQPSLSEGFGLTGVEALACHTPLLASDTPIFREVYGQHASYFDPHSVASCVNAIQQIEEAKFDWNSTDAFLTRYSWDQTATQTLAVYRQLLESNA